MLRTCTEARDGRPSCAFSSDVVAVEAEVAISSRVLSFLLGAIEGHDSSQQQGGVLCCDVRLTQVASKPGSSRAAL